MGITNSSIKVGGAREHNLKNIDLEIPRNQMVVFTGLSGSGKSSLAFDTIFAEGQRRYVESLSSYARQFLGQMQKPEVDYIDGLSPAVSIDQKSTNRNPRSTVGTITEIYDYLRLLFARAGIQHCSVCGAKIEAQSVQQMVDTILSYPIDSKIVLLAPLIRDRKGEYYDLLDNLQKQGFSRVRVDGEILELGSNIVLDKNLRHDIEVVIDRLKVKTEIQKRLTDSIETALNLSKGLLNVYFIDRPFGENKEQNAEEVSTKTTKGFSKSTTQSDQDPNLIRFNQNRSCPNQHPLTLEEIEPRTFSFNAPWGACPDCDGIGFKMQVDKDLVIPNEDLSISEGAIEPWAKMRSKVLDGEIAALSSVANFSLDTPFKKLPQNIQDIILYGKDFEITSRYRNRWGQWREYTTGFEGVINQMERRYQYTESDYAKEYYENYMREVNCASCQGARLKPEVLAVKIGKYSISEICDLSIDKSLDFFLNHSFSKQQLSIATEVLKEIRERLAFMVNVGLNYLTLSRAAKTLSGGEAQRIRLATQIGSGLMGVLYVLDEPSIGLHQRDNTRLIEALKGLRDKGNTLIVVEHDEETIEASDWMVDIGPKAGNEGGKIVFSGPIKSINKAKDSITIDYLLGKKKIEIPKTRRKGQGKAILIQDARENNLKHLDVEIPKGCFTVVTGVSGSGKSTLINSILYSNLANKLNHARLVPGRSKGLKNIDDLDKVIHVDQAPIGRTPRSNPSTYTGVWDKIRNLFAETTEAKARGYKVGRFSFNVAGGRCENCKGDGTIKIEMNFLPDVYVDCEVCHGKRFNRETLEVKYKGKNVADILDMPISEATTFFENIPSIVKYMKTLSDVGLGYVKMGQPAPTLSGGESQRVKLATELHKSSRGKTVYILDEPTTGLHFEDTRKLLLVLQSLVDLGNTVIVIEHNLDVIKSADWVIDLGPEGGDGGGEVIATGTPEQVAKNSKSETGKFLAKVL